MKRLSALLLFGLLCFSLIGCTDEKSAQRVLSDQGYTQINFTGYRIFSCGDDYQFHTGFAAKAPNTGRPVSGTVCSGWLKGNSIKLD